MKNLFFFILLISLSAFTYTGSHGRKPLQGKVVVDSRMSLKEALSGLYIPPNIKKNLRLVNVNYYSFDGRIHEGQLLIAADLTDEIRDIFLEIEQSRFPIGKIIPIAKYKWSDSLSMADNNTSAFNYRLVEGTHVMSSHASGRAIDINPLENPQIQNGKASPPGSVYIPGVPGTITPNSAVVKAFTKRGWKWGAAWKSSKDYQHFEKK